MELIQFDGKQVKIIDIDGRVHYGLVGDYVYPEDNENGKESIILDRINPKGIIEFWEEDIAKIEII